MHPMRLMGEELVKTPETILMTLVCVATKGHIWVHVPTAAGAMLMLWHV